MLESKDNRHLLDQLKDDSSSMIVLRDEGSFASTRSTGASSKLSKVFPGLDAELISSLVYQRAVRSLFKKASAKASSSILRSASDGTLRSGPTVMGRLFTSLSNKGDDDGNRDYQDNEVKLLLVGSSLDVIYTFLSEIHHRMPNPTARRSCQITNFLLYL